MGRDSQDMCRHTASPTPHPPSSSWEEHQPLSARSVDSAASPLGMRPEDQTPSCPQQWTSSDSDECCGVSPQRGFNSDTNTPSLLFGMKWRHLVLKIDPPKSDTIRPRRVRRNGFYISTERDLPTIDMSCQRHFTVRQIPSASLIPQPVIHQDPINSPPRPISHSQTGAGRTRTFGKESCREHALGSWCPDLDALIGVRLLEFEYSQSARSLLPEDFE